MPVTFGWSATDIVKAIDILGKVYAGLQEAGGSASRYQDITDFLKGLRLTLEHLQNLQLECTDPTLLSATRSLSQAAMKPILDFVDEVSKYESSLGRSPKENLVKAGYRKAQYAIQIPKKIVKLQADLAMKLAPINILMQREGMKQDDLTTARLCEVENTLQSQIRTQAAFNTALLNTMTDLSNAVQPRVRTDSMRGKHGLSRCPNSYEDSKEPIQVQSSQLRPCSLMVPPAEDGRVQVLKRVGDELFELLLLLLTKLAALMRFLLSVSPQMMLYFKKMFASIPRGARLLVQDDIHFEDFLGRVHHLPYHYFRNWEVFYPHLESLFKHERGEMLVRGGQFMIINAARGWTIGKTTTDWSRAVFPGSRIAMSAVLELESKVSACPRCRARVGVSKLHGSSVVCSTCSWECYSSKSEQSRDMIRSEKQEGVPNGPWQVNEPVEPVDPRERDLAVFKRVHTLTFRSHRGESALDARSSGEDPHVSRRRISPESSKGTALESDEGALPKFEDRARDEWDSETSLKSKTEAQTQSQGAAMMQSQSRPLSGMRIMPALKAEASSQQPVETSSTLNAKVVHQRKTDTLPMTSVESLTKLQSKSLPSPASGTSESQSKSWFSWLDFRLSSTTQSDRPPPTTQSDRPSPILQSKLPYLITQGCRSSPFTRSFDRLSPFRDPLSSTLSNDLHLGG